MAIAVYFIVGFIIALFVAKSETWGDDNVHVGYAFFVWPVIVLGWLIGFIGYFIGFISDKIFRGK